MEIVIKSNPPLESDFKNSFIDSGGDSRVYRFDEDKVIKFYHNPSFELVQTYAEVTNRAANYLEDNPLEGQLLLAERNYAYRYSVNPVLEVGVSYDKPYALSKFIPGPPLQALAEYYNRKKLENDIHNILDPRERKFFMHLLNTKNGYRKWFRDIPGTKIMDSQDAVTDRLSTLLEEQLDIKVIDIYDGNVKVRMTEPGKLDMIVTDLCRGFWYTGLTN